MKPEIKAELSKIREEFVISNNTLSKISDCFYIDMQEKTMLKMLRTHIYMDKENIISNEYLTIDIGGSNIRISKLRILEDSVNIEKMIKLPLKTRFTDYTTSKYTLRDLIVMILKKMAPYLEKEKMYTLAVTVSFGLKSKSSSEATIIELSKGFELSDTLGEDIYKILTDAIKKTGLKVIPTAIINDCVATLVSGNFYNPNADIGLIVGTGHNACFVNNEKEIINIESANFNKEIPLTRFDEKFLTRIPREADNLLEVLVGGKYICGIAEEIIKYLVKKGLMKDYKKFSTGDLTSALNDEIGLKYSSEQKEVMKELAEILFERAAKLVVAEIVAILSSIDKSLERKHTIVFDGSVYEKCEFFRNEISNAIGSFLLDDVSKISHKFIKEASSIGPAIISARA